MPSKRSSEAGRGHRAAIFDMDGTLIDSEPLWRAAEVDVFTGLGVPLTDEMARQTTGLTLAEVTRYWHRRHPWDHVPLAEVDRRVLTRMVELITTQGRARPGVPDALAAVRARGWRVALATASPRPLIAPVLAALALEDAFDAIVCVDDVEHGKPHPALFLEAARRLGVEPIRCVAVEDSVNGVIAAKAARMFTIAVPEAHLLDDRRFGIADAVFDAPGRITPAFLDAIPPP